MNPLKPHIGVMLFKCGDEYSFKIWPPGTQMSVVEVMRHCSDFCAQYSAAITAKLELERIARQWRKGG